MNYSIKMINLTKNSGETDHSSEVSLGDTLQYTLTAKNSGNQAVQAQNLVDDISDIDSYTDIIDVSGGALSSNRPKTISWQLDYLEPGKSSTRTILVKVKSSYSAIKSDNQSNLTFLLSNSFGNTVNTKLKKPLRQALFDKIALAMARGSSKPTLVAILSIFLTSSYLYISSLQKQKELSIIINEFNYKDKL